LICGVIAVSEECGALEASRPGLVTAGSPPFKSPLIAHFGVDMHATHRVTDWPASHLRAADLAFDTLTRPPKLLSLDCTRLGDVTGAEVSLPERPMLLSQLRTWMLAHRGNYPARDAVWRELIRRARGLGGDWLIAAVGMAMPRLVRCAGSLARDYPGDPADIDAAIVEGFLDALTRKVDLGADRPYVRLCWAAYRAGHAVRWADADVVFLEDLDSEGGAAPHLPYGHPDLLLARAVALGLIDIDEASLIIATRLEYAPIEALADAIDMDVSVLRMRRLRAERRVADGITEGLLSGPVSPHVRGKLAQRAIRRRAARQAATRPVAAA
jgi:hypothetical protein